MTNKGLTMTMVFEAESANYGEGLGNISVLKKMTRGNGNTYTYISRQALRYSMIHQLNWENTPLKKDKNNDKSPIQFAPEANIIEHPEVDLFGYMKTESEKGALTRSAVVRLSNAISLEPYNADTDFLTNMGIAKRINAMNAIAQREIHHSYYCYTITIDLDRVGVDSNTPEVELPVAERANRVCDFLETVHYLYRDIGARRENLSPLFVVGGVYNRKNPYFENLVGYSNGELDARGIFSMIDDNTDVAENTLCGITDGVFSNGDLIKKGFESHSVHASTVGEFFKTIMERVKAEYAE